MTPAELAQARAVLEGLEAALTLVVRPGLEAAHTARASEFAARLCDLVPERLSWRVEEVPDPDGASLGLARGSGRVPVRFRILPEGREFAVFLGALAALGRPPHQGQPAALDLPEPLAVEVMTLPLCSHCAPVAEALCRLAIGSGNLETCVIDLQQAPHYIGRFNLTATPTVIVNGRTFMRGRKAEELAVELAAIAAGEHEQIVLAARLESGEAALVAQECLRGQRLTPGLCPLVAAENFATRLGAIVALQEIAAASPELARQAVAELLPLLRRADPRDRGDAAYVLGELRQPEAQAHLERLLSDPDPEVVASAREALAKLT